MPEVSSATCDPSQQHFHVVRIGGLAFISPFVTLGPFIGYKFTKLMRVGYTLGVPQVFG